MQILLDRDNNNHPSFLFKKKNILGFKIYANFLSNLLYYNCYYSRVMTYFNSQGSDDAITPKVVTSYGSITSKGVLIL